MPIDLNIVTFIFFALAVVVFIQLRNVLGRRTGHERPRFDPYSGSAEAAVKAETEANAPAPEEGDPFAVIDSYAPAGSALNADLRSIRRADGSFAPQEFLAGAAAAYEMILTAFAAGDLAVLKKLLAKTVYEEFAAAIEERRAAGESVTFTFIGLEKAEIAAAALEEGEARLSVSFKGQIISAVYNAAGAVIDGNAQDIIPLRDYWTFTRAVAAKSPDWLLAATEEETEAAA